MRICVMPRPGVSSLVSIGNSRSRGPTAGGYEQLIEHSRDGGATWTLGGYVTFGSVGRRR